MSTNITSLQAAVRAEAVCYSLPYGGTGFTSHLVTYYTMVMLVLGRQPLPPFKPLKHQLWSSVLGGAQLLITTILSGVAMNRCRNQWAFILLAFWMLSTSICLSVLTIYAPSVFSREGSRNAGVSAFDRWRGVKVDNIKDDAQPLPAGEMAMKARAASTRTKARLSTRFHGEQDPGRASPDSLVQKEESTGSKLSIWICCVIAALWLCGCIAGVVAVFKVSMPRYSGFGPFYIETGIFAAFLFFGLSFIVIKCMFFTGLDCLPKRFWLAGIPLSVCAVGLLWTDWTLGLVTGNLAGMPADSTKVLYWTYIIVKRLGLLSM